MRTGDDEHTRSERQYVMQQVIALHISTVTSVSDTCHCRSDTSHG